MHEERVSKGMQWFSLKRKGDFWKENIYKMAVQALSNEVPTEHWQHLTLNNAL